RHALALAHDVANGIGAEHLLAIPCDLRLGNSLAEQGSEERRIAALERLLETAEQHLDAVGRWRLTAEGALAQQDDEDRPDASEGRRASADRVHPSVARVSARSAGDVRVVCVRHAAAATPGGASPRAQSDRRRAGVYPRIARPLRTSP